MKPQAPWIAQADDALRRAAIRAREIAIRTGTPLHVMRDGKIVQLLPALEQPSLKEEPPAYQTKTD